MKMDNIEFAIRLARVQDELASLYDYLENNSVIDEREDCMLLDIIRAAHEVTLSFNESIRAITQSL